MDYCFLKKTIFLLCFILFHSISFSQCPDSPGEWLQKLATIEESTETVSLRIENCNDLLQQYSKCSARKDSVYARILHRLGAFYSEVGNLEKAISITVEALRVNKAKTSFAEEPYLAHSYFNLGVYYNYLYMFPQSLEYFDSVIYISKKYPEKNFLALKAYQQKANTYYKASDFQKSVEVAEKGVLLAKSTEDTLLQGILFIQKAQSELLLNKIEKAERSINLVIKYFTNKAEFLEYLASAYFTLAEITLSRKEFAKAIKNYNRSFNINRQIHNYRQSAFDLLSLGYLYDKDLKDSKKAIDIYLRGIEIIKSINEPQHLSGFYINLGVVYWRQRDYYKALDYWQQGLKTISTSFKDDAISRNPTIQQLRLVANDYYAFQLLANKGESQLELYKAEKKLSFLNDALATFKLADFMIDQMRQKQVKDESKLYWRETTRKVYNNAIETCYLLNDPENAFFFFEKSRAVLLNDKLNELNAKIFLKEEALIKEQELRLKISSLQHELLSLQEGGGKYGQTKQELFEAQEELERYIKVLEKTNPAYYQYKYKTEVPAIEEVRKKVLKGDQALLEYFTTDEYLYALLITPQTAKIEKINLPNYSGIAQELNRYCANKSLLNEKYARYSTLAHKLYSHLFKPLGITTKRLIISPDGQFVPFELLLKNPENPTSFLLKDYIFSYAYSASVLMNSKNPGILEKETLLGVAPVDFQPYLKKSSLKGADFSLERIEDYFSSAHFLIRNKATKNEFLKMLPAYSIVQLYSHAEADTSDKEPVLYFYDSALQVSDLQHLSKLKTKLIILSACKTGVGKTVRGEGVFNLSRSFAAAGIPSTITNLWEIDNHSTYRLTELFYQYLNEGLASDEALQKAKLEFLENSDKEMQLPYYWASSILIGRADLKKDNSGFFDLDNLIILVGILAVLGLVVYLGLRYGV